MKINHTLSILNFIFGSSEDLEANYRRCSLTDANMLITPPFKFVLSYFSIETCVRNTRAFVRDA